MKYSAIFFFVLFAASSLAAIPPEGTWEWVSTEESAGVFTTPGDLGYTVQREFHPDLTYTEYRDEQVYRTGTYRVADVEFMGLIITALYIDYGPAPEQVCAYGFSSTELELFWGADAGGWPSFPLERLSSRDPVSSDVLSWDRVKSLYR